MIRCLMLGLLFVGLLTLPSWAEPARILFDDTHGQTAGNAEWTIQGAYSEMVDTIKAGGFAVDSLKMVAADNKTITPELLAGYKGIILAEPNNPYAKAEQEAIVEFVRNGGGAFLIGDHGGADRDNDGYDAVKALNEFCPQFGFTFNGDFFYEAPVSGTMNKEHPMMFGIRAIGCWAGSTFTINRQLGAAAVGLIESRRKKAPYLVASQFGKGRVVALGDSSPFDDGVGTGNNKLHDSYDSFIYSHPQLAYNAAEWMTGGTPSKRVPSRIVQYASQAKPSEKARNLLIDASHGNAASDKMETFERHMKKLGVNVYYTTTTITPEMLRSFSLLILPDPSLPIMETEASAICDWFMAGGRLLTTGDWDSADLAGRGYVNFLLSKLGSVMRLNDDQVWDQTNKTNKPWGVLAHVLNEKHPSMKDVKVVITWGTCSLMTRDSRPLTAAAGVDLLITGDNDTFNKDGDKKNNAVIYPKDVPVAIAAEEKLANGILVLIGCSNFTDYQYPDSDINLAKPGPAPFTHETTIFYDQMVSYLMGLDKASRSSAPARTNNRTKNRSR